MYLISRKNAMHVVFESVEDGEKFRDSLNMQIKALKSIDCLSGTMTVSRFDDRASEEDLEQEVRDLRGMVDSLKD
jgi:hypothetical protein